MSRTIRGGIRLPSAQDRDIIGQLAEALSDLSMLTHGELAVNVNGSGSSDLAASQTRARMVRLQGGAVSAGRVIRYETTEGARNIVFFNETAVDITVRSTAEGSGGVSVPAGTNREVFCVGDVTKLLHA